MGKTASHVTPAPHICHLPRILNRPVGHGLLPTAEKGLHRAQGPGPVPFVTPLHHGTSVWVGVSRTHEEVGMHPAEGTVTARGRPQTHLDECGCSPVTCLRSRSSIGRCGPPDLEQGDGLLPHGRSPSTTRRLCAIEVVGASTRAVRRAQPRPRTERRWVRMQRNSSSP